MSEHNELPILQEKVNFENLLDDDIALWGAVSTQHDARIVSCLGQLIRDQKKVLDLLDDIKQVLKQIRDEQ